MQMLTMLLLKHMQYAYHGKVGMIRDEKDGSKRERKSLQDGSETCKYVGLRERQAMAEFKMLRFS